MVELAAALRVRGAHPPAVPARVPRPPARRGGRATAKPKRCARSARRPRSQRPSPPRWPPSGGCARRPGRAGVMAIGGSTLALIDPASAPGRRRRRWAICLRGRQVAGVAAALASCRRSSCGARHARGRRRAARPPQRHGARGRRADHVRRRRGRAGTGLGRAAARGPRAGLRRAGRRAAHEIAGPPARRRRESRRAPTARGCRRQLTAGGARSWTRSACSPSRCPGRHRGLRARSRRARELSGALVMAAIQVAAVAGGSSSRLRPRSHRRKGVDASDT